MKRTLTDVLVIGAGPAGSIAAAMVNKAGFKVQVAEREKFPRFVIGESLLPRCMEVLKEANLLEAVKGGNFQEKFGAKFLKDNTVADYNFSDQFTEGWSWTWQVQRAEFDSLIASEVANQGVPINFETTVTNIRFFEDETSIATLQNNAGVMEEVEARFVIDASGYGRVIPKLLNFQKVSTMDTRKAVFAHLKDIHRDSFDEPNRIIIVVYAPGVWVWIIPFSNGTTSVGFVGQREFFQNYSGDLKTQFINLIDGLPYLKKRFSDSPFVMEPAKLESWSSNSEKFYGDGYVLTGNVTEFLDPIFSSGVMFATVSSHLASELVIQKLRGEKFDWHSEYTQKLQKGVDTFRAFVSGWYDGTLEKIFFTHDPDPLIKRQICSVLAGYVWDETNPFVKNPEAALKKLVKQIQLRDRYNAAQEK
jgi:flavin-dependent dehydrogenase